MQETNDKQEQKIRDYVAAGEKLGSLVKAKNNAYGDSVAVTGRILKELYPNGIAANEKAMNDVGIIVRVLDKLFRIASQKAAFGENPWQDIAGYALLKTEIDRTEDK